MEEIIDTRIKKDVTFHDILHVFFVGSGTVTVIIKLNLAQYMNSVYHDPLLLVFLDLIKPYDKLALGQLLKTLEVYGTGPKMWGILLEFWALQ